MARSRTHLSKSDIPGSFSKLGTKTTRLNDSFHKSALNWPQQMLWIELRRHDGMRAYSAWGGIQTFTWMAEFSTLRLGHERSGQGCIGREANDHNRFLDGSYQSIKSRYQATNRAITIHSVSDSRGRAGHRSRFLFFCSCP